MKAPRRLAELLTGAALCVALVAAALWLWPVDARVEALRPVVDAAPRTPADVAPPPRDLALAGRVVDANVFAASRRPPRVRWASPDAGFGMEDAPLPTATLPGLAPDPTVAIEPAFGARPPDDPSTRDAPTAPTAPADPGTRARDGRVPALFGTVAGPDGVRALLRLDPRVPGAQLYGVGAEAGGWRVAQVEADRVVLTGRGRRTTTLRLPRAAAPPATLPP